MQIIMMLKTISANCFVLNSCVALLIEESGCDVLILEDSPVKILRFNSKCFENLLEYSLFVRNFYQLDENIYTAYM